MSFLQKIKNVFSDDQNEAKGDDAEISESNFNIGNVVIEKSLDLVIKLYEKRMDFINKLSLKENEWLFYDNQNTYYLIEDCYANIEKLEKSIKVTNNAISGIQQKIENLDNKMVQTKREIDQMKSQQLSIDFEAIKAKIKKREVEYLNFESDKNKKTGNLNDMLIENKEKSDAIFSLKYNIVQISSTLDCSAEKCIEMAKGFNLPFEDNYLKNALISLMYYEKNEIENAFKYAGIYFTTGTAAFENHRLNEIYGNYLFSICRYEEAKKYIANAIQKIPESYQLHNLLSQIHGKLNEVEQAKLETTIANLLK